MARNDAFDAFDAFGAFDAFDAFDAFGGGGGQASSGRLAEALIRSREGHLGRPARPPATAFDSYPGLIRNWGKGTGGTSADKAKSLAMPEPGPHWLTRMDSRHRAQLCVAELMQGVRFDDAGKAVAPGSLLHLNDTAELTLDRPSQAVFIEQTKRVESWASLRSERAVEIIAQIPPQQAFWSSIVHLNADATHYTNELLDVAVALASNVVQQVKYRVVCPRPSEYSARIQPMIAVPGHFAWPSGHATQAFMIAELLSLLILDPTSNTLKFQWPEVRLQLLRQAERIATNRVVAGLHFPVDSTAGFVLGTKLAHMVVDSAVGRGVPNGQRRWALSVESSTDGCDDFALLESLLALSRVHKLVDKPNEPGGAAFDLKPISCNTPIQWLWARARSEWHDAGQV